MNAQLGGQFSPSSSGKIGLYIQDNISLSSAIKHVQYAELRGFHAIWQAESRLVRDSIVPLAAYAAVTTRIKLGSGVMNIWTRNPATIASTFFTLDEIAPDRMICGLGTWHEPLATQVGVQRNKHLLAMREVLTTVRDLLNLETVTLQGDFVHFTNVKIDTTVSRKVPRDVKMMIAATGAKMMALAGEISDGVLLNYLVSPAYTADSMTQIEIGAKQARRSLDEIERPQLIVCSVDNNRQKALDLARPLVAQYIYQQPAMMRANGIRHELIDDINHIFQSSAPSHQQALQASQLVSDETVQLVTASGTPDECKAKIREYIQAGATYPVLYPLNTDIRSFIDTFANGY